MYKIMIASSFILGLPTAAYLQKRKNVPLNIIGLSVALEIPLCLYMAVLMTFLLSKGKNIGLNSTGAALGMLLGAIIFSKITPQYKKEFFISYEIILPLMYGLGKIGCACAGCCAGIPYNGLFRVHTKNGEAFPIQKLEAIVFLLLFAVSIVLYFKKRFNPLVAAIVYSTTKIVLDFLRASHIGHVITSNQIMCAVVMAVFVLIIYKEQFYIKD